MCKGYDGHSLIQSHGGDRKMRNIYQTFWTLKESKSCFNRVIHLFKLILQKRIKKIEFMGFHLILFLLVFSSISQANAPLEQIAKTRIEYHNHDLHNGKLSLVTVPILKSRTNSNDLLTSVVTKKNLEKNKSTINRYNAFVNAGLLKSSLSSDEYTYSLTRKGWGLLLGRGELYLGQYVLDKVNIIEEIQIDGKAPVKAYLAEGVWSVTDIQDWAKDHELLKAYPQLRNYYQTPKVEKYILYVPPVDENEHFQVLTQLSQLQKKQPKYQTPNFIKLVDPISPSDKDFAEKYIKQLQAKPATDEDIIQSIKNKLDRIKADKLEVLGYKRLTIGASPYTHGFINFVSEPIYQEGNIIYCSYSFTFDRTTRETSTTKGMCKSFMNDPLN